MFKSNVPVHITNKIGHKLHNKQNHPIQIIKKHIQNILLTLNNELIIYDDLDPLVTVEDNFDNLLIPINHPSRSFSDTYYVDELHVLRTHTTAHQYKLLESGIYNFLVTGDVYRKDEIDKYHYPIFHQMEGVMKLVKSDNKNYKDIINNILGTLVTKLFPNNEYRILDDYFPFTEHSYEIEVFLTDRDKWLEVLGCGFIHNEIKNKLNLDPNYEYLAFGLGLDRLAMVLFNIPDIRYLWSSDKEFMDQFKTGEIEKIVFKTYSTLTKIHKDIAFYLDNDRIDGINNWLDENNFFEMVRNICGDSIESVELKDEFHNIKKNLVSRMYRLTFSPLSTEINPAEFNIRCNNLSKCISDEIKNFNCTLR